MTRAGRSTLHFDVYHLLGDVDLLYRGAEVVPLEPRAVRVLRYLVSHHDRVLSKSELLDQVWSDAVTTEGVLKRAISQIRRALQDDAEESKFIETYHGRGYRFIGSVRRGEVEAPPVASAPVADRSRQEEMIPNYDQFKGRDAQLAELYAGFESARRGKPRPVVVTGDPGIGKTQLSRHFREWAAERGAITLYGRFLDRGTARSGAAEMFLDLLASALGTRSNLRQEIEQRCGVSLPAELFSGGERKVDRLSVAVPIARCFLQLARQAPLVLVLDDLQWADDASLDIIGCMLRLLESECVTMLLLVRPEEDRSRAVADWLAEHALRRSYTTLHLGGLDDAACRDVIGSVFDTELPQADIERLHHLTGGNPYFLIEILRMLVAGNAVAPNREQQRWVWKGIGDLTLPASLVTASRARIEQLSPAVLELVEQASVIGDEFRIDVLARVAGLPEETVEGLLAEATRAGIIAFQNVSRGEDCRFQHSIQWHVLYGSVSPHRRRRLHAATAEALTVLYAENLDRVASSLSVHYAGAGDSRRTFEWSLRAWRLAARRCEWRKAAVLVARAREAAVQVPPSRNEAIELLLAAGETSLAAGASQEGLALVEQGRDAAAEAADHAAMARALILEGQARIALSDYGAARTALLGALDLFNKVEDFDAANAAILQLAFVENARGECVSAAELASEVLSAGVAESSAAQAKAILGWSHALRGHFAEGKKLLSGALEFYDRAGDLRARSTTLRRLHWIDLCRGDYESAIATATRARNDAIAIGDALAEAKADMGVGQARIAQGLYEEGMAMLQRTLERLNVVGDAHCEAEALWLLGVARFENGELDSAAELIPRALAMVRRIGDRDDECRMLIDLARLELLRGNAAVAREAANAARTIAVELKNDEARSMAALQVAAADLDSGEIDAALATAEDAVRVLEHLGSSERWRGYAILGRIRGAAGDHPAARSALERSVALVEAIREQIPIADTGRRLIIARNRSAPQRELERLNGSSP